MVAKVQVKCYFWLEGGLSLLDTVSLYQVSPPGYETGQIKAVVRKCTCTQQHSAQTPSFC